MRVRLFRLGRNGQHGPRSFIDSAQGGRVGRQVKLRADRGVGVWSVESAGSAGIGLKMGKRMDRVVGRQVWMPWPMFLDVDHGRRLHGRLSIFFPQPLGQQCNRSQGHADKDDDKHTANVVDGNAVVRLAVTIAVLLALSVLVPPEKEVDKMAKVDKEELFSTPLFSSSGQLTHHFSFNASNFRRFNKFKMAELSSSFKVEFSGTAKANGFRLNSLPT